MRLIGAVFTETHAERLAAYLSRQGIDHRIDALLDAETGQFSYQVWVSDEDQLAKAKEALQRFEQDPADPIFDLSFAPPIVEAPIEEEKPENLVTSFQLSSPITLFFLALCTAIYLINLMQEMSMQKEFSTVLLTPVQELLLFDLPPAMEQLESWIQEQMPTEPVTAQQSQEMSPELRAQIDAFMKAPYWKGVYDWTLAKCKHQSTAQGEGPLCWKIRQGEWWRLFSPCILHLNLLHILFNMIWLWVLGRPIEQRIGMVRTLLMIIVVGVISNMAQYLMSGPFFLGYSGVIMGQAGFIWMRERLAPWEGYPLQQSTVAFLLLFIGSMMGLQLLSFFVQLFTKLPFVLNIANTAHVVGALVGMGFGRMQAFAWRVR